MPQKKLSSGAGAAGEAPERRAPRWNDIMWSTVLHSGALVPALGADGAARLARVSREARGEFAAAPEALWGSLYASASRAELKRLFWRALRAGETAHVALALRAASHPARGDFRAELLLLHDDNQQNGDQCCLYACAMSNDVATARVLVEAAREAGVLQALLLLLNMGRSCLLPCVTDGHAEMLEVLLAGAAAAPLVEGELSCLFLLLELHADDDDEAGGGCLQFAAVCGDLRTLSVLLEAGRSAGAMSALLHARDHRDATCLHWAAEKGELRPVEMLLEAARDAGVQPQLLNARNDDGETCLHVAVDNGNLEVVRALLAVGGAALAGVGGDDGNTALHVAVRSGDLGLVHVLLDVGGRALLLRTNNEGCSCVHVSTERVCEDESAQRSLLPVVNTLLGFANRLGGGVLGVALLLRDNSGWSCLLTATASRHSGVMRALLGYAHMAGVEQQLLLMTSDEGDSCLMHAAGLGEDPPWPVQRQSAAVLAALLDSPFARELVTLRNWAGRTALEAAVELGHTQAVRVMLAWQRDAGAARVRAYGGRG